jgi:hypothetical protein
VEAGGMNENVEGSLEIIEKLGGEEFPGVFILGCELEIYMLKGLTLSVTNKVGGRYIDVLVINLQAYTT